MKILHCVEYYEPSRGGAQEVVRQISERLAGRGHEVTVATSSLPERCFFFLNGVRICPFDVSGNAVEGLVGRVREYREFLMGHQADAIMFYAAQQWTLDAALPVLAKIQAKKFLAPCGFSNLRNLRWKRYFEELRSVIGLFDGLIFHSNTYQDHAFARECGCLRKWVIPNGCGGDEFQGARAGFRRRFGISSKDRLIITIGSHTGAKGHSELLNAFELLRTDGVTLAIIGNTIPSPTVNSPALRTVAGELVRKVVRLFRRGGLALVVNRVRGRSGGCLASCRKAARRIERRSGGRKPVLILDVDREAVVAALHEADLFVLPSNVECSPLVLFEAMAARTAFLSTECGNAREVVEWSGGGRIVPTRVRRDGWVECAPDVLAGEIERLLTDQVQTRKLGAAGRRAWENSFTWERIVELYERAYSGCLPYD